MMWGYEQGMAWTWLWGFLLLIGIALLVTLAVRLFGGGVGRGHDNSAMAKSRARQILDERFAAGELTADQYREQLRVLGEGP